MVFEIVNNLNISIRFEKLKEFYDIIFQINRISLFFSATIAFHLFL